MKKKLFIKIKGVEHEMPTNLNKISCAKGRKISSSMSIKCEERLRMSMLVSELIDVKPSLFDEAKVTDEELKILYDLSRQVVDRCKVPLYKYMQVDKQFYAMQDLDKLTVQQYMDIDFAMNEDTNVMDCAGDLMRILYKPVKMRFIPFNRHEISKDVYVLRYGLIKGEGNKPINYEKVSAGYLTCFFSYVMSYKLDINKSFPTLFDEKKADLEDEEVGFCENKYTVAKVWGWYDVINRVTTSKMELDYWLDKPIREFLTYISYVNQRATEEKTNNK